MIGKLNIKTLSKEYKQSLTAEYMLDTRYSLKFWKEEN